MTGTIGAIVRKDLVLYARDRFYAVMTIVGLVFYVVVFWLLPSHVDETVRVGLHAGNLGEFAALLVAAPEGLELERFGSTDELRAAVAAGDLAAGIEVPDTFVADVRAGHPTTVAIVLSGDVPADVRGALTGLVREIGHLVAGEPLPVSGLDTRELIVGPDRAGEQVSLRERMRPLLVFGALLLEMLALATLVATEIQSRTVTAVLATPARVADFLAAKAVVGTGLAFGEAVVLLALTGSLAVRPDVLLVTTFLGAVLVTGLALLAGSTGRDFIGIVFWSMLLMIPMMIPAIATLFPGSPAAWVRILPTYGLVQAIVGVTAYGEGWARSATDLVGLVAWCLVAFVAGLVVLQRKVVRL